MECAAILPPVKLCRKCFELLPIFCPYDQGQSARCADSDYTVAIDRLIDGLCTSFPEYALDSNKPFGVEPVLRRRLDAYEFLGSCLGIVFVSVADQREEGKIFENPNNKKSLSRPDREARGFNQNPQHKSEQKPLWDLEQQIFRERFYSDWRTRRNPTFTAASFL